MIQKVLKTIPSILMVGLFLSIPVTNFPFFPAGFGGNVAGVRPLLVYPLFGLVLLVTIPRLISKPLPRPIVILSLFFLWGLIVSIIPPLKGIVSPWGEVSLLPRELRTILTLGLGLFLYFTISLFPQSVSELRFSLRWLYIGLGLVLTWGSLQAIYIINLIPGWYGIMSKLQNLITVQPLNSQRVSGMTFEPSSFADQLIVIWLPWVLAASLDDYTVFLWRWKWITIERILCVWTMVILAFTLSRTGLIVGLGVVSFAFILKNIDPRMKDRRRKNGEQGQSSLVQILQKFRFLLIILGIGVFLGIFYVLGQKSDYISLMWEYSPFKSGFNLRKYFNNIGFGARIAYWDTALQIFMSYPVLGVGLGNYTLYFSEFLPYQKLSVIPELLRHIVPVANRTRVITVKHFLARILAEMGIVGFGIFVVFLIVLTAMAIYLWTSKDSEERFWGTAAIVGLVAFLGATFSFDSFAIPNPWILFGLITAAFNVYSRMVKNRRNPGE